MSCPCLFYSPCIPAANLSLSPSTKDGSKVPSTSKTSKAKGASLYRAHASFTHRVCQPPTCLFHRPPSLRRKFRAPQRPQRRKVRHHIARTPLLLTLYASRQVSFHATAPCRHQYATTSSRPRVILTLVSGKSNPEPEATPTYAGPVRRKYAPKIPPGHPYDYRTKKQ